LIPKCKNSRKKKKETGMAKSRPAGQTKGQEGNTQAVETVAVILGRV